MIRHSYGMVPFLVAAACLGADAIQEASTSGLKGVYAVNGRLHVSVFGTPDGQPITTGPGDMKPSWSKTAGKIVFFRLMKHAPRVSDWQTAICVVNTDGTGFRKLTDGTQTDFNPTWTRDGTEKVVFSRYDHTSLKAAVYMTMPIPARATRPSSAI